MPKRSATRARLIRLDLVRVLRRHTDECIRRGEVPSSASAAASLGITPVLLAQILRTRYGASPLEVIHERQVEHADRLLARPSLTISEVAARSGFGSRRNFDRIFRRVTGTTAEEWRDRRAPR